MVAARIVGFLLAALAAGTAAAEQRLLMVEQPGCGWCARWDAEIAPAYPDTEEGARAPLDRVMLREAPPPGVTFRRPVRYTPTFVLLEDGAELGRIEGYPGADFFWPMLAALLDAAPAGDAR